MQDTLLDGAERALGRILEETKELDLLTAVGVPVRHQGELYNCAALSHKGRLLGLVPKTYLPNYSEFYEQRWFASGGGLRDYGSLADRFRISAAPAPARAAEGVSAAHRSSQTSTPITSSGKEAHFSKILLYIGAFCPASSA